MIDVNGKIKYSEIHLGGRNISEMYYGVHRIWPEESSEDFNFVFKRIARNGTEYVLNCPNNSSYLSRDQFISGLTNYDISGLTENSPVTAIFGDCLSYKGQNEAHQSCTGLTSLESAIISKEAKSLYQVFNKCSSLSSVVFQDNSKITSLVETFANCPSLKEISIPKTSTLTSLGGTFLSCGIEEITIPENIQYLSSSFWGCRSLSSVTFEGKTLLDLGDDSFRSCVSLKSISLPDTIIRLGKSCFYDCSELVEINGLENTKIVEIPDLFVRNSVSLKGVTLPDGCTKIGSSAFTECISFEKINLDNITEIDSYAFSGCSKITSLTFSDNLSQIGNDAFNGCTSIESFTFKNPNPPTLGVRAFDNTNNCPIYVPCESLSAYLNATTWKNYANRIRPIEDECGNYLLKRVARDGSVYYIGCGSGSGANSLGSIISPTQGMKSTSSLNSSTDGETPVEVYIGECCNSIGINCFNDWRYLRNVYIYGNTDIGNQAFTDCDRLEYIELNGVSDKIVSMYIETNVPCKMVVNGQINYIYSLLVSPYSKHLEGLYMHQLTPPLIDTNSLDCIDVIYVPCEAVDTYKQKWSKYADIIIAWDYDKNSYCPMYRWDVEGDRCVDGDLYENLVQKVSNDGGKTWSTVYPLQEKQGELIQEGGCPTVDGGDYEYTTSDGQTFVKEGRKTNSSSGRWMDVRDLPDDIVSLKIGCSVPNVSVIQGTNTINTYEQLKSLYICDDVIDLSACFENCTALTDVRLSNNMTRNVCFEGCTSLEKISIPNSVTDIPYFKDCTSLKDVKLSENTTELNYYSFNGCTSLEHIDLPSSLQKISSTAFTQCVMLKEIVIPDSVTELGNRVFVGCTSLTSVTLSNNITSIEAYTFEKCAFESITIPSKVNKIGEYPFDGCSNLKEITILATTPPNLYSSGNFRNLDITIYVPSESLDKYKSASNWKAYADRIQPIT